MAEGSAADLQKNVERARELEVRLDGCGAWPVCSSCAIAELTLPVVVSRVQVPGRDQQRKEPLRRPRQAHLERQQGRAAAGAGPCSTQVAHSPRVLVWGARRSCAKRGCRPRAAARRRPTRPPLPSACTRWRTAWRRPTARSARCSSPTRRCVRASKTCARSASCSPTSTPSSRSSSRGRSARWRSSSSAPTRHARASSGEAGAVRRGFGSLTSILLNSGGTGVRAARRHPDAAGGAAGAGHKGDGAV